MGKANKVKKEFLDVVEMSDLVQTLKDIADNKLFTLMAQKDKFRRFGETFIEFFRLISLTSAAHPLLTNNNPNVGILMVTIDGSFLGEFNNKIVNKALEEAEKYSNVKYIAVGHKAESRLQEFTSDFKLFTDMEAIGTYNLAMQVKDYLVDEIMNGRLGKVIAVYSFPKSLETQRPKVLKLLPCDELISKQAQFVDIVESVIEESDPAQVIGYLANLWITTRLYEIFIDTTIASAAAQSNFLEESVDRMKKERRSMQMKFRKAKKNDIDKSLRETFTARMMVMKS
jgi:ATP synthase F1 gamma subunit